LLLDPTRSNIAIAAVVGCAHSTVARIRLAMLANGELAD
jgi:hypothetical protein